MNASLAPFCHTQVDESNVMVLDSSNMTAALEHNDALMIKFFAPWCGNCQRLAPKYAKAATELAVDGIRLAKVMGMGDCSLFILMYSFHPCVVA